MLKIYSIFDKQTDLHGRPFALINDTLAQRAYQDLASDPKSDMNKYPQDYKLVCLGHLDPKTGDIKPERYDVITT